MGVLAKLKCDSVTDTFNDQKVIKLSAVTTGSEENKSFSRWTPSANLEMIISNETTAGEYFEPGKEYLLTFEKV